jgi:Flp pilus assembly secretin CpaC
MTSSGENVSRSRWLITALTVGLVIWVGGVCTLFAQTNTEHNAEKALRDLQIDTSIDEPNIPIPEIYETSPKIVSQIVGGKEEFKLLYFCKQHTSDELKKIIHEQFATKLFDEKGKSTQVTDYTVSSNPATNQLIVRCPLHEDAEAVLELLESVDVPPIQVKIDCLVSEIYADFTFDRETTIEIGELFGEDIAMKPGGLPFGSSVQDLIDEGSEIPPAFPGASLRELIRARMGLNIGYLSTAREFTALVDLLESRGYLKVLMNPMIETINGKTSVVKSTEHVPLQTVTKFIPTQGDYLPQTEIQYEDVVDSLEITPHVFADGTIGLETDILLGARNTPDGVKQVPIITKREITSKENRIRPGESLIIGGIRKTIDFGVVRGVPILKDIPLLGFLFSGEDTEKRTVETVFVLTPTYSTGGRPKQEIMKELRKKHDPASPGALQNVITDFFGDKSAEEQQKNLEAERSRLKDDAINVQIRSSARESEARAERLTSEAQKATTDAAKTKADADQLMEEAKKLMAAAEAKAKAAEKAKKEADAKAKAAEKAKQEAEAEKAKEKAK